MEWQRRIEKRDTDFREKPGMEKAGSTMVETFCEPVPRFAPIIPNNSLFSIPKSP